MSDERFDIVPGHGGARRGSGRKRGGAEAFTQYAEARARHETAKANLAELEFRIKSGLDLERARVQQAAATAFATIAQTLRGIPDRLERTMGIDPATAEAIGKVIDSAMSDVALRLEKLPEIHTQARSRAIRPNRGHGQTPT